MPRAFVSYSDDRNEHSDKVLALALQLPREGIDARLDRFEQSPPPGWPALVCAVDSRFELCLAREHEELLRPLSSVLKNSALALGEVRRQLIQNILNYDEVSTEFIPVIFTSSDESHIPETDTAYGDLESRRFTAANFEPPHRRTRYQHGTPQGHQR